MATHILAHKKKITYKPKGILPAKALLFAHPLEIHERIMLEICKPELLTTLRSTSLYKLTWLKNATGINSRYLTNSGLPLAWSVYNFPILST